MPVHERGPISDFGLLACAILSHPERGLRVNPATLEDLKTGVALHELLEHFAIQQLAEMRLTETESFRKPADKIAAAMRHEFSCGYTEGDCAFHLGLVSHVNNSMLTKSIMEPHDHDRIRTLEPVFTRASQSG